MSVDNMQKDQSRTTELSGNNFVSQDDTIGMFVALGIIRKNIKMILLLAFAGVVIAYINSSLQTPLYKVDATLSPINCNGNTNKSRDLGALAVLAGFSVSRIGSVQTIIHTIESNKFLTEFINENQLKRVLYSENWDSESEHWIVKEPSLTSRLKSIILPDLKSSERNIDITPGEPTDWQASRFFADNVLNISSLHKSAIIKLSVTWKDPVVAAEWANSLVHEINSTVRENAINEAMQSIKYLEEQLQKTSVTALQTILYQLIEEHTKNITLANVSDEYALKFIDPAVPPDSPSSPNSQRAALLGFLIGFILGVLIAVVRSELVRLNAKLS